MRGTARLAQSLIPILCIEHNYNIHNQCNINNNTVKTYGFEQLCEALPEDGVYNTMKHVGEI